MKIRCHRLTKIAITALVLSCHISSAPEADAVHAKKLNAEQEAIWDEQESLYEKVRFSTMSDAPALVPRLQKLLTKQESAFGHDSPQVACTLDKLWAIYGDINKPKLQIPLVQRSLSIKRTLLGPYHVDTAYELCHLASSLTADKQYVSALSLLTEYQKQLPASQTRTVEIMTDFEIGQTYFAWNKFKDAAPWFDKALLLKTKYSPRSRVYPAYSRAQIGRENNLRALETGFKSQSAAAPRNQAIQPRSAKDARPPKDLDE